VQRVVAASSELSIDEEQVLNSGHFRGDDDSIVTETHFFRHSCGSQRALKHRFDVDFFCSTRSRVKRILVHQGCQQILIQRAPVHPDSDRLVVVERDPDNRAEIFVTAFSADITGVDTVFGERFCRRGIFCEQQMTVVVEVANEWN